ncbi:hypothetical protein GCM10027060_18890 [Nesterenkonia halophila]|uniref:hypothetical protein n=1 Tax=Nesterenkonia halophila TaxID=302044 RepID=UPI001292A990|nr:hypothetical protein [Nesterenkonia halophila]
MDSRFPTHYLNYRDVLRLSPAAFRTFVLSTAWSVSNMTDGSIPRADLPLVPFATEEHAAELVSSGLWSESDDGYVITEFAKHQTSAARMEASLTNRRETDRARKQRERKHRSGDHSSCLSEHCDEADSAPPQEESRGLSRDRHVRLEGKAEAEAEAEAVQGVHEFVDEETGEVFDSASTSDSSDSTPLSSRVPSFSEAPEYRSADPFGSTSSSSASSPDGPSSVDFDALLDEFRNPGVA